jgi:CheY-like chemotaxis protein
MRPRKLRVFVVEDHPGTTRALKGFLRGAGFEVQVATDVTSALELAGRIEFDVLLCDLNLPDGTGWDLLAQLSEEGPVRAIAFSAFDEPEHVARSEAAGFLEHFVKGSPPEDLLAAIRKAAAFPLPAPATRQPP